MTTITSILPYFGGKRSMAPQIVAELGDHSAYWEPFCGSMAVLLAKPACAMEVVNDLNKSLVNLARVIRHPTFGSALYRRLRRTLASKDLMDEAASAQKSPCCDHVEGNCAECAYHYFLASWLGRNGVSGTKSYNQGFCRRFTKNGGHSAKRWASACDSLPAWRRRMRQVTILREDGISLIERIEDAEGVVIYVDPPYVEKGALYVHDFVLDDHARLAAALRRFKRTRVVVSYYEHPLVRELYRGWTFVDCARTKALVNQGMRDQKGSVKAPELLIINQKSFTQNEGVLPYEIPQNSDRRSAPMV